MELDNKDRDMLKTIAYYLISEAVDENLSDAHREAAAEAWLDPEAFVDRCEELIPFLSDPNTSKETVGESNWLAVECLVQWKIKRQEMEELEKDTS